MKLEDYLKAIKECSDDKIRINNTNGHDELSMLTAEWGIYNNFTIDLHANFDSIVKYFKEYNQYTFLSFSGSKNSQSFNYLSGTVVLHISSSIIEPNFLVGDYIMSLMLTWSQKKQYKDVSPIRAIALVLDDIGQFILKENIPARLPWSVGWKYFDPNRASRVVVHEPKNPISDYLKVRNISR